MFHCGFQDVAEHVAPKLTSQFSLLTFFSREGDHILFKMRIFSSSSCLKYGISYWKEENVHILYVSSALTAHSFLSHLFTLKIN